MNAKEIAPGKRGTQKTASRFQRLWAEAEALAKDNIELESELDALVSRIDRVPSILVYKYAASAMHSDQSSVKNVGLISFSSQGVPV
ncbi:MAG: hypothetical protein ACI8VW_003367 [bacterium]|jgi:hypothetical protein